MKPNVIIVKIDDILYQGIINGLGEPMGKHLLPFESDYDINDNQIIFSSFDTKDNSSVEVARFSITDSLDENISRSIKYILEKNPDEFKDIVKHLFGEIKYEQV